MKNMDVLEKIRGRLIVSCQALESEPLYCREHSIMDYMAKAAFLGGAGGIRANSIRDIQAIRKAVDLPLIGIIKKDYPDSEIYITPTMEEVDQLVLAGCDVIALDATNRTRPKGLGLEEFFSVCREKYPDQLFMADCSTYSEGMRAAALGFDLIGTTLAGYTPYTKGRSLPDFEMMERLVNSGCRVIAEGGVWSPEQLTTAFSKGVFAAVAGSAITRPMEITKRFAAAARVPEKAL